MTIPSVPRTPSDAPWDLSFLRVGTVVTMLAAVVGAPVAGLLAGWPGAVGVVLGALIVVAFFAVSSSVVALAGRIGDTLTLPAALLAFFVKALLLFAILDALPAEGWVDQRALAWSVVAGALVWSGVQLRWVWTRRLYYVTPPRQPGLRVDPGGPATGG